MKSQQFEDTHLLRLEQGDEIYQTVLKYCTEHAIRLAQVSGIGATDKLTVGLFNTATKTYQSQEFEGDFEIISLQGNISSMEGTTYVHLHIGFSDEHYRAYGGHLNEARISATGEIIIRSIKGDVDRFKDANSGLNFWKL